MQIQFDPDPSNSQGRRFVLEGDGTAGTAPSDGCDMNLTDLVYSDFSVFADKIALCIRGWSAKFFDKIVSNLLKGLGSVG
jgi:hypothetical protein